jgi:formate hydrogenlyase transcriptional activator
VRELHNVIERVVILSPGPLLEIPPLLPPSDNTARSGNLRALEGVEREHILCTLVETSWVISGSQGSGGDMANPI